jgi:hypothetical protein
VEAIFFFFSTTFAIHFKCSEALPRHHGYEGLALARGTSPQVLVTEPVPTTFLSDYNSGLCHIWMEHLHGKIREDKKTKFGGLVEREE